MLLLAAVGALAGCAPVRQPPTWTGPGGQVTLTPHGTLPTAPTVSVSQPAPPRVTSGAGQAKGVLASRVWAGARVPWLLATPASPRGLLVALHGKGSDAAASVALGITARGVADGLAVVAASGGNGYWHRRADGRDPGGMVLTELIPLALERSGLDSDAPVGFLGWSMGGYGSLLLASRLPRDRLLGVAPMSAALWTSGRATAPGAFDSASDYAANDVFAASRALPGRLVRMVCGTSDPFIAANRAYVARRPATQHVFDAGGHTAAYWSSHVPGQVAFLSRRL